MPPLTREDMLSIFTHEDTTGLESMSNAAVPTISASPGLVICRNSTSMFHLTHFVSTSGTSSAELAMFHFPHE